MANAINCSLTPPEKERKRGLRPWQIKGLASSSFLLTVKTTFQAFKFSLNNGNFDFVQHCHTHLHSDSFCKQSWQSNLCCQNVWYQAKFLSYPYHGCPFGHWIYIAFFHYDSSCHLWANLREILWLSAIWSCYYSAVQPNVFHNDIVHKVSQSKT